MSEPKIITYKEAKSQINTLGISLFIYIIVLCVLNNAFIFKTDIFNDLLGLTVTDNQMYSIMYLIYIILMLLISFVPFTFSAKILSFNPKDYYRKVRVPLGTLICLICLGVGLQLIVTSLLTLFGLNANDFIYNLKDLGKFYSVESIIVNVTYILSFVIVKPICEEYVFRGIIQRKLGHFSRNFGVFASAFLYALVQSSFADFLPSFCLGLFMGLICLKYHSIRPCIKVQIGISTFYLLASYIPDKFYYVVFAIVVAIFIIDTFTLYSKVVKFPKISSRAFDKDLWMMMLSSYSVIVCIIIQVLDFILVEFLR